MEPLGRHCLWYPQLDIVQGEQPPPRGGVRGSFGGGGWAAGGGVGGGWGCQEGDALLRATYSLALKEEFFFGGGGVLTHDKLKHRVPQKKSSQRLHKKSTICKNFYFKGGG